MPVCKSEEIMETTVPMNCCRARPSAQAKPTVAARLIVLAIAVTALLLMVNGGSWLLEESPAAANELTVATCIFDVVYGEGAQPDACTSANQNEDKGNAL
jgi:hypothetical protein